MDYGLNRENQTLINNKAKDKNDGVFTFRGVYYRVRNGRVTHYAAFGKVVESAGAFNVTVGSYDWQIKTGRDVLMAI